ncbi:hypothetical protein [Streptomyces sp. NPDC050255]|uniref:hypothetical protein n=1 Tax=Streptomyces sp. NPDC050255 TaxID=3365606 RepID=UPI0037A7590F
MKAELDSRATALHVKTDDLLKDSPHLAPWRPAVGIAPQLTDAELVTRAMMQAMPGFTSEAKWLRHAAPPRGHRKPPATRRRRGFTLADPLGTLAILSVVAVVALWVMNQGGPLSLTTPDRAMGSLGLLTGLLASDLMILQVVLLARIPWVERSWGHDLLCAGTCCAP